MTLEYITRWWEQEQVYRQTAGVFRRMPKGPVYWIIR